MRWKENDIVWTKYGAGRIKRIWPINNIITAYDIELFYFQGNKMKVCYYGEIIEHVKMDYNEYPDGTIVPSLYQ